MASGQVENLAVCVARLTFADSTSGIVRKAFSTWLTQEAQDIPPIFTVCD